MPFDVPGHQETETTTPAEAVTPRQVAAEMQAPLDEAQHGRDALQQDIEGSLWADIPSSARDYLEKQCAQKQSPEFFTLAMNEAAKSLKNDPSVFDDPDLAPFMLDDCIKTVEIAAKTEGQETRQAQIAVKAEGQETRQAQIAVKAEGQETRQAQIAVKAEGQETRQAQIAALDQAEETETAQITALKAEEAEVNTTNAVLTKLDKLAREESEKGGSIDARLQRVIDRIEETFSNQEEREVARKEIARVQASLNRMRSVVTNPQERQAFETILSTANLNLGAASQQGVFINVLAQVESSDQISEETKANIRASIGMPQVNTGSQAQDILRETRVDEQGRTVPVWTEKQPLNIRDGVSMHSDPNMRQIMRAEFNGHITEIDTTGWSGEVVGKYLEAMSFVRDVESYGGTGLFQSIYKIDFNLTGEEGFDAHKVDQILNIMGKWFGGFEHADGDVRQNGERRGFIRYVVRLLNKRGTATGFEESQADSNEVLTELGLRNKDGSPNWLQIDRMGDFARSTYISGDADYEDLKAHLVGDEQVPLTGENAPEDSQARA